MSSHSEALIQILSQNQAVTTLFLEKVIRELDIGVHEHEFGSPQHLSFDIHVMPVSYTHLTLPTICSV